MELAMADLPSRSDDPIFQKLSRESVDDEVLRQEEDRFEELVVTFSDLIRADVERAATEAPAEEVSAELLAAATALLGKAPPSPTEPATEESASEQIRREIAEEIRKDIGKPDAEELEETVRDLSQGLISNWLAVLQKANRLRESSSPAPQLSADALPVNGFARGLLFQGLELHALTNELLETRFRAFLQKLREPSLLGLGARALKSLFGRRDFRAVNLAPDLALVSGDQDVWYLASGMGEATRLVEKLKAEQPERDQEPVPDFSTEWALSAVQACTRITREASWDQVMVLEVIDKAAHDAVSDFHRRITSGSHQHVVVGGKGVGFGRSDVRMAGISVIPDFSEEVVAMITGSLDPAPNQTTPSPAQAWEKMQSGIARMCTILDEPQYDEAPTLEACQVIVGTAARAVVMAAAMRAGTAVSRPHVRYTSVKTAAVENMARQMATVVLSTPQAQSSIAALAHYDLRAYS
jgi:hypothetical protein